MNITTDLIEIEKMNLDELIRYINHLIAKDFSKLVYILYAIDVSEKN